MHPSQLIFARGLLGLGAPELIVVMLVLFVLYAGTRGPGRGAPRDSDPGLTPYEKQILLAVGVAVAVGIGILVWLNRR